MGFQAVRGTADLLPDDLARVLRVEHAARRLARLCGYQELRTPVIEDAALFLRSVGETTDIVQKEMFRVERMSQSGGSSDQEREPAAIALRPEGTVPVVRAYLEHNLHKTQGFAKLFYLGPMFRAERPQAGRFRQFHQYGVEAIGSASPWVDVEVIVLCVSILNACGVADAAVWLASMGCRNDQERSAAALRERLAPFKETLCKECQARFEKNVFRVLDCKNPACHKIACLPAPPQNVGAAQAGATHGSPFLLCKECHAHFDAVREGLRNAGIAFDDTKVFARGLDYYTRTVFEVRATGLGAQDAVAAGGRYDHLVEDLGGPPMGAVGFAAGIERVLLAVAPPPAASPKANIGPPGRATGGGARCGVYLAVAQPTLLQDGFRFVQQLRERGVPAAMDYDGKSLKAQLREADKGGARFVAILGEAEITQRAMTLKDLEQGAQRTVSFDVFVDEVIQQTRPLCH